MTEIAEGQTRGFIFDGWLWGGGGGGTSDVTELEVGNKGISQVCWSSVGRTCNFRASGLSGTILL